MGCHLLGARISYAHTAPTHPALNYSHKQSYSWPASSSMSKSSSLSCISSITSGKLLLLAFARKDGEAGLSATEEWYVDSMDEAELGYLMCRAEKVGVTGEVASEVDEVRVW